MNPDIRPNRQPRSENGEWIFLNRPRRNNQNPSTEWERKWLNHFEEDWQRLKQVALESLSAQEDVALKPELLTPESINDKFTFKRSDIGIQIVNIGIPADVKKVFNYFKIGTEQEPMFKGTGHEERVYEVTRGELFQIFIAVSARLGIRGGSSKRRSNKLKTLRRVRGRLPLPSVMFKSLSWEITPPQKPPKPILQVESAPTMQIKTETKIQASTIEFRTRTPITDFETREEIDRLMRRKPERGGPMMNVR